MASTPGARHALILCGHPGDEEHRALFAESIERLHKALTEQYEFGADNVRVLFAEGPMDEDGAAVSGSKPCTREEITTAAAELMSRVGPADVLWVVAMGHAHYDGRKSWLNLPGSDIASDEFAGLFEGAAAGEQVFWITTSVSGFFIKPLSAKGRIVITATEPDLEVNETLFPHALATVLEEPPAIAEYDADGDRLITVFDAYVAVVRNVMQQYADQMALPTEHALLDDNGDGRGTELQIDYLPQELGGRTVTVRPVIPTGADGYLAARTLLKPLPPPAPVREQRGGLSRFLDLFRETQP